MSNYPAKFLPFYLMAALILLFIPGFCAQIELTEIQKQAIIYRQQGWQLQEEGKIDEAFSYYQKAMLLDPNFVMAYNDAGVMLEAMGYPEQAKQMYLKAIEIDLDYPNSYSSLALLYEEEKDYTNAILYWIKRATLGGPQDPWAEMARRRVEDITRIYPEAYRNIPEQYKENLQQEKQKRLKEEEEKRLLEEKKQKDKQLAEQKSQQALDEAKKKKQELAFQKKQEKEYLLQGKEQKRLKEEEEKRLKQRDKQLAEQKSQQALDEVEKRKTEQAFKEEQSKEFELSGVKEPQEVSLFREQTTAYSQMPDNKTRALQHLALAKKSFSKGDYVAALKEATVAEYFDSSNAEITAFVETIRKKLLK